MTRTPSPHLPPEQRTATPLTLASAFDKEADK